MLRGPTQLSTRIARRQPSLRASIAFVATFACRGVDTTMTIGAAEEVVPALPSLERLEFGAPLANLESSQPSDGWSAAPVLSHLTFDMPVQLLQEPGSGRLIIVEREGRVFAVDPRAAPADKQLVLDISSITQGYGDCGLLGLAFHPDYAREDSPNRGVFFIHYQHSDHPQPPPIAADVQSRWRLARLRVDPITQTADPGSMVVLIDQLDENPMHAGGSMFFHPTDGFLYVTVGDEGGGDCNFDNCQRMDRDLYSGVLRIDVDMRGGASSHAPPRAPESGSSGNYFIPNDNPFVGEPGVLEEFYAIGLRSPHRMTYDAEDDIAFIGDVGQRSRDEIDVLSRGANYQWPVREGTLDTGLASSQSFGTWTDPILELGRDEAHAVVGGEVYRGARFPELQGKYIFADFYYGSVWALSYTKTASGVQLGQRERLLTSFRDRIGTITGLGFDSEGEIYVLTGDPETTLWRLERTGPSRALPDTLSATGLFSSTRELSPSDELLPYAINSPLFSDGAVKRRWVRLPEGTRAEFSESGAWGFPEGSVFVKHFEMAMDERQPQATTRLETRVLVAASAGQYAALSYRWDREGDASGEDAHAVRSPQIDLLQIVDVDGRVREQPYLFPGPGDCAICHNAESGHVLGVRTAQLNAEVTYGDAAVHENQLVKWSELTIIDQRITADSARGYARLAPLADETRTPEDRIRSYWDSNCSMCHGVLDGIPASWDARYAVPLEDQGVLGAPPWEGNGADGLVLVAPGAPENSLIYIRSSSDLPDVRMPPIGRFRVDEPYVDLLEHWILSL